jgi:membrane associated rhomboid family serine protease
MVIGWLERRFFSLILSVFALISYAGILPSLLPIFSPSGVSWIGHFSGFIGGIVAAYAVAREKPRRVTDLRDNS